MMSVIALDDIASFLRLKDTTNTCIHMQNNLILAGFLQCNGGKFEEAEDFKCVFFAYCVFETKYTEQK